VWNEASLGTGVEYQSEAKQRNIQELGRLRGSSAFKVPIMDRIFALMKIVLHV
jgi:hypothetical protein